jgi:hypothetical protein
MFIRRIIEYAQEYVRPLLLYRFLLRTCGMYQKEHQPICEDNYFKNIFVHVYINTSFQRKEFSQ